MAIMTHAKFDFNWLMLTLIFGIWASEPSPGPGERLKRPGLIGLRFKVVDSCWTFLTKWSDTFSSFFVYGNEQES